MLERINWISVAVASLATFLVGGPWYSAALFGTSFGVNYQFANRPGSVLFIDGGYHIAQFSLMGAVLGVWHS